MKNSIGMIYESDFLSDFMAALSGLYEGGVRLVMNVKNRSKKLLQIFVRMIGRAKHTTKCWWHTEGPQYLMIGMLAAVVICLQIRSIL